MSDEQHVSLLRRSVREWNRWRVENPQVTPDLADAGLRGLDLSGALIRFNPSYIRPRHPYSRAYALHNLIVLIYRFSFIIERWSRPPHGSNQTQGA